MSARCQVIRYDHRGREFPGEVISTDQIPDVELVGEEDWADNENNDPIRARIQESLSLDGRYWLHGRLLLKATAAPITPGGWDNTMGGTR